MDLKNEYFKIGQEEGDKNPPEEYIVLAFTPADAHDFKIQLEEQIYKGRYEKNFEPFIIAVGGHVKSQHITLR